MHVQRPAPDPKRDSLQRSRALHPHPERVCDDAFLAHPEFFDARDLVQVKYEMLRRARGRTREVSDTARTFGLSRPAFYQAAQAFAHDGLAGLVPHRPGPHGPRKFTPEVVTFLASERRRDPTASASRLAERIEEAFHIRIHPQSITRHLRVGDKKNTP